MVEAYLVLPTVKGSSSAQNTPFYKGPPYTAYVIGSVEKNFVPSKSDPEKFIERGKIGKPPYYRVAGFEGKELVLEELAEGSQEYATVEKWVGGNGSKYTTRRILNHPNASGIYLSKEDVIGMLRKNDKNS